MQSCGLLSVQNLMKNGSGDEATAEGSGGS